MKKYIVILIAALFVSQKVMAAPSLLNGKKDIYLTPDMAQIDGSSHSEKKPGFRYNSGIEFPVVTVNRRMFNHVISFHANDGGPVRNSASKGAAKQKERRKKAGRKGPDFLQFVIKMNEKYKWFSGYYGFEDMMIEDYMESRSRFNAGIKITIYADDKEIFTSGDWHQQEIKGVEQNIPHYFCVATTGARELKIKITRPKKSLSCNGILLSPKLYIGKEKPKQPKLPGQNNEAKQTGQSSPPETPWAFWSRRPARWWSVRSYHNDAYPIGNGSLRSMIFGGINMDRVQLNLDSFWTGGPDRREGKTKGNDLGKGFQISFGSIFIDPVDLKEVNNYRRELDLDEGIVKVKYESQGTLYTREYFVSYPDKALIVRLSADKPGKISGTYYPVSTQKKTVTKSLENDTIVMKGQIEKNGMKFDSRLQVRHTGGKIKKNKEAINIDGADSVTLVFVADTEFFNKYPDFTGEDPVKKNNKKMLKLAKLSYAKLRKNHVDDYSSLMNRFYLNFTGGKDLSKLETSERKRLLYENGSDKNTHILNDIKHWDPQLFALYVQWGRHLLISASRPGSMPINLFPWQDSLQPIWDGDFHWNINIQMPYWLNEVSGLHETAEPLISYLGNFSTGAGLLVAKEFADFDGGHKEGGWAMQWKTSLHHDSSGAMDGGTIAGWSVSHVWEHYLFTMDKEFLEKKCYPIIKGAAEFLSHHLKPNTRGQLMVPHGHSWEGCPQNIIDGKKFYSLKGKKVGTYKDYPELNHDKYETDKLDNNRDHDECSCDLMIIKNTFDSVIQMSKLLGKDKEFAAKLEAQLKKLSPPLKIGAGGQIQEWANPYWEQAGHRHMSHLLSLYPFHMISPVTTPKYAKAAMISMDNRGYGQTTSWSHGWRACLATRLFQGDIAIKQVYDQMYNHLPAEGANMFTMHNLPLNDGNGSAASGIVEMLMQSHAGFIHILPALPALLPDGEVRGMKARGDFTVDMQWKDGELVKCSILSGDGGKCRVLYKHKMLEVDTKAKKRYDFTLSDFTKGKNIEYAEIKSQGTRAALKAKDGKFIKK